MWLNFSNKCQSIVNFFAPNYNFKQYIYMNQFFNQLSNNCLQKFWHQSNYKQYFLLHTLSLNYQSIRHLKVYHQTNFNQYFLFHHIFDQLSINYLLHIMVSNKHQTIIEPDRKFQLLSIILKLKLLFEKFSHSIILSIPNYNCI